MKRLQLFGASLLSGILLWAAWPTSSLTFLVFFGFVPLMLVAGAVQKRKIFFLHSFIAMLVWNALTTWWIWNSSAAGAISAILPNAAIMCIPWMGYFVFSKRFGRKAGYFSLVAFWMMFEYIHLNWQLSWPWLSLGNVFAQNVNWVQWYEYTGIGGGTLWVLLVNVLVFDLLKRFKAEGLRFKVIGLLKMLALLAVPIVTSILLSDIFITTKFGSDSSVVIVQPNIDPYQKFESNNTAEQIAILIALSEKKIDSSTKLVLWPETALSTNVPIDKLQMAPVYRPVFDFINKHPNITLLTGLETNKFVQEKTLYARRTQDGYYYESYNAAVSLKANEQPQFYIKSKLVPGVETLPTYLNFMGDIFEKFGGTTGGYAKDTASVVFKNNGNPFIPAPVICYESIYGEYVSSYVAKGANLISIITNDGWWGNTPGHKQHLAYAKLRAIETRRYVARSANTGISAVIDEYGNVLQETKWDEATAFKFNIPEKQHLTFYVKHGDYLYRFFFYIGWLLMAYNLFVWIKNKLAKK